MGQFEQRMTALFNTAGKDTAERLTRLEAVLSGQSAAAEPVQPKAELPTPVARPVTPAEPSAGEATEDRFEAMLSALSGSRSAAKRDTMPANPADEAPLIDPGFKDEGPVRAALEAKVGVRPRSPIAEQLVVEQPAIERPATPLFDPATAQRPPRPQSSFAAPEKDPFGPPPSSVAPRVDAPVSVSGTSTFVAAARRAQRARQEASAPNIASSNSLIGRALARVMPNQTADAAPIDAPEIATPAPKPEKAVKPPKPPREKKEKPVEAPVVAPTFGAETDAGAGVEQQSFLTRHRRPLLLAATLVAVSMLALNLVIQRMGPAAPPASVEATVEPPATDPASDEVSLVRPEARIIDMIDGTATGSISPNVAMSFTKPVAATAMPPALMAFDGGAGDVVPGDVPVEAEPEVTGSIPDTTAAETFELPAEAAGPIELRQAAADGDARAQFEIGAIYTEGRAVTQDYAEAAKWYERAAAQGFVPAQYRLGNLYEAGQGVEKDIEIAKLWYQRAAEAGNRMAMHNLAALYAGGLLGEQEFETAAEWFAQAAAKGMTDSQFNLGMLYARGLGVEQDFNASYKWFSLAARNGDKDATQARDDMAKSLNAEQVNAVNAEVAGWKSEQLDLAANFAPLGTWSKTFDPGEVITTRDVVSRVQLVLGKLGFDVGTADGVAGPKTADAIKSFERGTGMSESGAINPRLLAVLGSQPV